MVPGVQMAAAALLSFPFRASVPLSVAMTSAGALGWTSDRRGYRYEPRQPDGRAWPPIPARLLALWAEVTGAAVAPDSCLVNLYREGARMGLHQDRNEAELGWPVVSVSLGDAALFRVGGVERGGPTQSLWLNSGDVVVLCEGDPFFYGSFMHLYVRLQGRVPVEVIPGVTAACAAAVCNATQPP